MKKIEAIIRPLKLEELKDALNKADVHGNNFPSNGLW